MQLFLPAIVILVFTYLIYRLPFFQNLPSISTHLLLVFWFLKILAGFALVFIYTYYYPDRQTADIYKYFDDGRIMYDVLKENPAEYFRMLTGIGATAEHLEVHYSRMFNWYKPWSTFLYNDNRLVIRFNALIFLFSNGNILVHSIVFNFFSFVGLVALYKFMSKYADPQRISWLPMGVFLFPSLLFWGSGMLKEAVLMGFFGVWVFNADKLISLKKCKPGGCFVLVFTTFFLSLLKPYTLLLFLPCFLAFYISLKKDWITAHLVWFSIMVLLFISSILVRYFIPAFDLPEILASKQNEFIFYSLYHNAGSLIHTHFLKPDITEIAMAFFRGLFHALSRPFITEVDSPVILIAAIENLFILAMLGWFVFRFDPKSFTRWPAIWLSLWFVILFIGLVGMISPAYGGLVRYKIPALPFLWFFLIHGLRLPQINPVGGFLRLASDRNEKHE